MERNNALRNSLPGLGLALVSMLPSMLSNNPAEPASRGTIRAAAAVVATAPPLGSQRVFFGNLHAHTKYSDGSGTPADAFAQARNQGKLDFLAVTEHNQRKGRGTRT